MTTKPTISKTFPPLPDPPEREPEDMTSYQHLSKTGNAYHLIKHFGAPETTIVEGERYLTREPGVPTSERMAPDLLIAFNVDPDTYRRNNGYVISEQGKPPDFVLEIASKGTARNDVENKSPAYARLDIPEYWRFDETGRFHGAQLAGDRLVEDRYQPIPIETVGDGVLQGYSAALNLFIRWEQGELRWHDPATGQHIATFDHERARANRAEAQRDTAEARIQELEAEIARRNREDQTPG